MIPVPAAAGKNIKNAAVNKMKRNFFKKKKITSTHLWLWAGAIGLAIFIGFNEYTFPEATVDIKLSKKEVLQRADDFLRAQGFKAEGYQKTIIFDACSPVYLQKTQGLERTLELLKEEVPCFSWEVRYFKELEKEGFYLGLDPSNGKLVYFHHGLMDDASGAHLSQGEAKTRAENFLTVLSYDLSKYEIKDVSTNELKNRTVHNFEWEKLNYKLGEAGLRIFVTIDGDSLGGFSIYLDTPEQFERDLIKESTPGMILSFIFGIALLGIFLASIFILIIQYKHSRVNWRMAFLFGLVLVPLGILSFFNSLPLFWSAYEDTISKNVYFGMAIASAVLGSILGGLAIFLFCASGESLSRDLKLPRMPLVEAIRRKYVTIRRVIPTYTVGYSLAFLHLGYLIVFYHVATRFLKVWMPIDSSYTNMLGTSLPFLFPLTIAVSAALSEEFMFRLFAIAFFKKYLKKIWIAVFISSVLWAFAHSNYPIYPNYIRGIELTIVGIVYSLVYLKYGIEATIISHYVYNAMLVGWPLLKADSLYFKTSGILVLLLVFLPLAFIPFLRRKKSSKT